MGMKGSRVFNRMGTEEPMELGAGKGVKALRGQWDSQVTSQGAEVTGKDKS